VHTAEFPALIARLGQQVTPHEVQQMIDAMDPQKDGKIW
jgi:Ca2+-binding EF-hand superfamily protein